MNMLQWICYNEHITNKNSMSPLTLLLLYPTKRGLLAIEALVNRLRSFMVRSNSYCVYVTSQERGRYTQYWVSGGTGGVELVEDPACKTS